MYSDRLIIEEIPVIKYLLENNDNCKLINIQIQESYCPDIVVKKIIEEMFDIQGKSYFVLRYHLIYFTGN